MRVPAEAKLGKVKVTFSFDAWKEWHVAPSTWEYTIVGSEPSDKKTAAQTNDKEKK